ncbi:MAG: hypothetical protein EPN60_03105 [Nevskiaceae bacterium]|nr:MAG: hypothetical protein EPO48_09400 [Nevskiaceae bacterium]TAM32878.1 MAG: hypothetical protein EPN60_03105 [Nevskiaceae bacterium]
MSYQHHQSQMSGFGAGRALRRVGLLLLTLLFGTAAGADEARPAAAAVPGFQALFLAGPNLYSGGPPDRASLEKLRDMGLRHVIDLRPAEPGMETEAAWAAELGLSFRRLPVRGAEDLTPEMVRRLDQELATLKGEPVLVHCASGNRSSALLALRASWIEGLPPEEALRLGQRGGLTKLAPAVRKALGLPASEAASTVSLPATSCVSASSGTPDAAAGCP